jgi:predicted AAA+ superfamily ATPase
VAIAGPRQSGKTTLARAQFPDKPYASLENPDEREFALSDPRRFLDRFPDGAILDEVQRCPALFSWLQGVVDDRQRMGDFVLTGSSQFDLIAGIGQSLAGRVGRVELLPLAQSEMRQAGCLPDTLDQLLLNGGYPAVYSRQLAPADWYGNYVSTYLERDVRQLLEIKDLALFQRFLKLCAARTGQLLNLSALGADCGITGVTARQWMSVLEASYLVTLVQPYHRNFGKRLVKTPKLYFLDTGLAAWLLGIRDVATMALHPQRGALFETWVVAEQVKQAFNLGETPGISFWRDRAGHEVDLIREDALRVYPTEIKSGATFATDWANALQKLKALAGEDVADPRIVYGGDASFERDGYHVVGWRDLG